MILIIITFIIAVVFTYLAMRIMDTMPENSQPITENSPVQQDTKQNSDTKGFDRAAFIKFIASEAEMDANNAIRALREQLVKNADDDELRKMLVNIQLNNRKYTEAIKNLEYLLSKTPNDIELNLQLASSCKFSGVVSKAIETYKKIISEDNQNREALLSLGKIYIEEGQVRLAIETYRQLLNVVKNKDEIISIHCVLARQYEALQEYENAIKAYKNILEITPSDVKIMRAMKNIYKKLEDNESVMSLLKEITDNFENDYEALEELLCLLYKENKYDEVIELTNKIINYPNADIENIQNIIAKVYLKTERYNESIELLNKILINVPENRYLKQTLAKAYAAVGKYDNAINIYMTLIESGNENETQLLKSNVSAVFCLYGEKFYKESEYTEAFKKLHLALEYDRENSDAYYHIGYCYYLAKNYSEAFQNVSKSLQFEPENIEYRMLLATILFEQDNLSEALSIYCEIVDKAPQYTDIYFKIWNICEKLLYYGKGVAYFETGVYRNPDCIPLRLGLANAYLSSSDFDSARKEFVKILELDPQNEEAQRHLEAM